MRFWEVLHECLRGGKILHTTHFPLTAIVGQESVKRALMAALVNPRAGGLLISGTRGTAKSVLVRAAAPFTPTGRIAELPLGASEDMLFGTIDVEAALQHGARRLRRGILHRARNTVLYMDEVNLLREDLLAAVLRCAADGLLRLERDGLSCAEAVFYTPIGTMDPAEGTLRPALLDSFGMFAAMDGEQDAALRREIVARVLAYERDPLAFCASYAAQEAALLEQIRGARRLLPSVESPSAILHFAAACVLRARCAGNHAEIYLVEAARALAALAGRDYVLPADVEEAASFVLVHRMSRPREEEQPRAQQESPPPQENRESDDLPDAPAPSSSEDGSGAEASETQQEGEDAGASSEEMPSADDERVAAPLENVMACLSLLHMKLREQGGKSGRRDIVRTRTAGGRCLRTELPHGGARPCGTCRTGLCAADRCGGGGGVCARASHEPPA